MSKASEWEGAARRADEMHVGMRFNGGALIHERLFVTVERNPVMTLRVKPTTNNPQLADSITVNLTPDKALTLAQWILDTFGDPAPSTVGRAP